MSTDSARWPSVIIVVPTYNERDNLPQLLDAVSRSVPGAHLLIVDDNSPDGTGLVAEELTAKHPQAISVVHRPAKSGLGAAYVDGYRNALSRWPMVQHFAQMDADLSHDPAYLPDMLDALATADVVIGSRYLHGISIVNWPLHRLIISQLGTAYARLVTGLPATDCTSGFKCYRAQVLRDLDLDSLRSNGYIFQVETIFRAWRLGYQLKDHPIIFYERRIGTTKLSLRIAFEALYIVARLGLMRIFTRKRSRPRPKDIETT